LKTIILSPRLKLLADMIRPGASVVDVGSDHGLLPIYLAQTASVRNIIASDINEASTAYAMRSAMKYNVSGKIKFITAPGLTGIRSSEIDTIIIAGLGGETILGILKETSWIKQFNYNLILQPQSKLDLLSGFLYDNDYKITETKIVRDRGKKYTVILSESNVLIKAYSQNFEGN